MDQLYNAHRERLLYALARAVVEFADTVDYD